MYDSRPQDAKFRHLFEQAPVSMQLFDLTGRTLRVNAAWERLWLGTFGDGLKDFVLHGDYNLFTDPQLVQSGVAGLLQRAAAGESVTVPPILYDPAMLGLEGRARWVAAQAHPIRDDSGAIVEVMLVHDDITERLELQHALEQTQVQLQRTSDWLQDALTIGRMVAWEWDLDSGFVKYSDNAREVLGYGDGDVGSGFSTMVEEDARALRAAMDAAIANGGPFATLTRRFRPDTGQLIWVDTMGRVLRNDAGEAVALRGVTLDVTDSKSADQRKDEFLAMLAHELRNPIAPIDAAAQLLLLAPDAARARQAGEVIQRQVRHMTRLVDDLLDVSRVTRGLAQLASAPVDLRDAVSGAVEQVRPLITQNQHTLVLDLSSAPLIVQGDHNRLVQVLANLLNNAARYTPPGGRVVLALEAVDGQARVRVEDNGAGLEPGFMPHLFELFTQGARSPDRAQGGLGLGLALVRSIVELHGGRVSALSDGPGQGSTFVVTLPLAAHAAPAQTNGPQAVAGRARSLVVVDDNEDAAWTLAGLLESHGHRVAVVTDPHDAARVAAAVRADACILDIGLPGMDGYALARQLRADPATRHLTLLALTGYGQPADRERARDAGFDHHFLKPADLGALLAALA